MEHRADNRRMAVRVPGTYRTAGLGIVVAAVVLVLGGWLIRGLSAPVSETASQPSRAAEDPSRAGEIHALARLEPASGLILVGSRPGARIEQILVGQGYNVTAGDRLAILEGHGLATVQVAVAEAQKARAIHQRELQKQKLTLEREQFDKLQKARLESAPRVLSAKALFDQITTRYKELQPTLQGKDRFDLELKYLQAENQNLKDTLEVKSVQIGQELTPQKRRLEDGELGEKSPDLDVLDRQIELARAGLAQTEVYAPSAGQVLEIAAHAGEIGAGPFLTLGDVSAMAAVAEVFQSDVTRLTEGDSASVRVLDQAVTGKVTRIGRLVARNQLANLDPRALQDRRVVKVTIRLDDPSLAARLVNMEVEAVISPARAGAAAVAPRTEQ